jgi:P-type Ca2+ transporter type 2C
MNSIYLKKGLTTHQVKTRLKEFGYNEIKSKNKFRVLKILLSQFKSFLIIILIIAGVISMALHETIDGIAIFTIVIINAIIGFFQEYKAENAVNALKKMVVPKTIVLRNGQEQEVPIKELVPDDLVILNEGDKIPADMEIIESFSLQIDESMLTGESVSVNKQKSSGKEGKLFKGTIITTGRATAKVLATGIHTEFGKIIDLVSKQEKTRSPLTIQLDNLSKKLGILILILILILFVLGQFRGINLLEMFMTSVALGVSAIPEGMPIIVTLTLAIGVQILAGKKAIVRKMNSIETLGATTIICSDKTGTLTLNEMTVKKIFTNFTGKVIPGQGYKWKERFKINTFEEKKLMEICENCNNSIVNKNILGDPTEIALKILNRKAGYKKTYKELDEKVFTSERKMMSTLSKVGSEKIIFSKGAFEELIKRCSHISLNGKKVKLNAKHKKDLKKTVTEYSKEALRVLAFAYKPSTGKFEEKDLIFVGLTAMIDPPRKSVKASLQAAQEAGIKVKIITGDNPLTAKAIGQSIGLNVTNAVTGAQIDRLSDKELLKLIHQTQIFARTSPQHKYRIVDLLKKDKEVIAVTGDGVNDAPALKHADVGIAMGIKGTEATKEVADIILKDDNFSTIVNTIREGRRIYENILSFIKYMLSANFDTIATVGILTIMGFPLPILPLQILWINLATDALPALALGTSKAAPGIMKVPPHPKHEKLLHKFFDFILVAVFLQVIANLSLYFYGRHMDILNNVDLSLLSEPSHARTLVFTEIVVFELFLAFVCKKTSNKTLFAAVGISFLLQLMMLYTPFMQSVFKTVPLSLTEWAMIVLFALTAFLVPPITRVIRKLRPLT